MGPEERQNDPSVEGDRDRSESQQPHDPRLSTEEIEKAGRAGERGEINSFAIVGIGASAGGLDAMTQLLQALPADTGMAFVLVQHLDPTHESLLATILARSPPYGRRFSAGAGRRPGAPGDWRHTLGYRQ